MAAQNTLAQQFKQLHAPGNPLILANVHDVISAEAVATLESAKAIATASFAVARTYGLSDDDLDMERALEAAEAIGRVVSKYGKPYTVDVQDGYGDNIEHIITSIIGFGAVGCNLEDYDNVNKQLFPADEAVVRIKRALDAAKKAGVPDFVVNARCDGLLFDFDLEEVIKRGKMYLAAGATTVFVWGAKRGVRTEEVERLTKEFSGLLNVSMRLEQGKLTAPELAKIGVARISIGPQLYHAAMKHLGEEADRVLTSI